MGGFREVKCLEIGLWFECGMEFEGGGGALG